MENTPWLSVEVPFFDPLTFMEAPASAAPEDLSTIFPERVFCASRRNEQQIKTG